MDGSKSRTDERLPGLRIVVVDDSRDTARMMQLLLRFQGHEVKLAFAGREAIELVESFRPRCRPSGPETTRRRVERMLHP